MQKPLGKLEFAFPGRERAPFKTNYLGFRLLIHLAITQIVAYYLITHAILMVVCLWIDLKQLQSILDTVYVEFTYCVSYNNLIKMPILCYWFSFFTKIHNERYNAINNYFSSLPPSPFSHMYEYEFVLLLYQIKSSLYNEKNCYYHKKFTFVHSIPFICQFLKKFKSSKVYYRFLISGYRCFFILTSWLYWMSCQKIHFFLMRELYFTRN